MSTEPGAASASDTTQKKNAGSEKAEGEGERIVLKMKKGQYVGLGCPDPNKRAREADIGEGYTHDHPARSFWKDEHWQDENGYPRSKEVYVDGELIQLWPTPKHEAELAKSLTAANKRQTFSYREAKKHADKMVKDGIAEPVHFLAL